VNTKNLIVALSVAANLALAGMLVMTLQARATSSPKASNTSERIKPQADHIAPGKEAWNRLVAEGDDSTLVARLRAEGFPPSVVRALTAVRVKQRFSDRIKALYATASFPYWRSETYAFTPLTPEARAARRQIDREVAELLKQLLGPESSAPEGYDRALVHRFGNLPSEKLAQLKSIETDYSELSTQVRDAAQGVLLEEDYAKLAYLEKEKREDVSRLLSPEELAQYELRASPTAQVLKYQLAGFEPSEAEFQLLYKLQRDFDEQYGITNLSGRREERRRTALPELTAKIQAALSPERFADYKASTDPTFQSVRSLVRQLELPSATTMELIRFQQATNSQAESLRTDSTLTNEQRASALAALSREATTKLTTTLGEDGLRAYQQRGGQWLKKLQATSKQ